MQRSHVDIQYTLHRVRGSSEKYWSYFYFFWKIPKSSPAFFIDFNICISTLSIDIIPLFFRIYISNLRINSPQNYSFSSTGKTIQPFFLLSSILLSSLHSSGTLTVRWRRREGRSSSANNFWRSLSEDLPWSQSPCAGPSETRGRHTPARDSLILSF